MKIKMLFESISVIGFIILVSTIGSTVLGFTENIFDKSANNPTRITRSADIEIVGFYPTKNHLLVCVLQNKGPGTISCIYIHAKATQPWMRYSDVDELNLIQAYGHPWVENTTKVVSILNLYRPGFFKISVEIYNQELPNLIVDSIDHIMLITKRHIRPSWFEIKISS